MGGPQGHSPGVVLTRGMAATTALATGQSLITIAIVGRLRWLFLRVFDLPCYPYMPVACLAPAPCPCERLRGCWVSIDCSTDCYQGTLVRVRVRLGADVAVALHGVWDGSTPAF